MPEYLGWSAIARAEPENVSDTSSLKFTIRTRRHKWLIHRSAIQRMSIHWVRGKACSVLGVFPAQRARDIALSTQSRRAWASSAEGAERDGLRNTVVAGRFQNLCGIGIKDEGPPCLLGCPIYRDDAVDVLCRAGDEHDAWCGLEAFSRA